MRIYLSARYRRSSAAPQAQRRQNTPFGRSGEQSLKKFLIDKKVPLYKRDSLVLAARGSEVLAVIGLTVAQSAAVKGQKRRYIPH